MTPATAQAQVKLTDEDVATVILSELKRTCHEYAIAATESNCAMIRKTNIDMWNQTVQLQEKFYQFMQQNNWYGPAIVAPKTEMDNQLTKMNQLMQQLQPFMNV